MGRIAHFISSPRGQRFFNFAYSIGAAIVIWGALFSILHLPGGNLLLAIGMGTEVLMFILTAFDYSAGGGGQAACYTPGNDAARKPADTETMPAHGATMVSQAVEAAGACTSAIESMAAEMERLRAATARLNEATESLLQSYKAVSDRSGALNAICEIQLRDAVAAGARYGEEADRMARSMRQLNAVYDNMLKAMHGDKPADNTI